MLIYTGQICDTFVVMFVNAVEAERT